MRMLRWISGNIGFEMANSLTYRGDPYWWKEGRIAWDGLVTCKGEWLMHQSRVSWFKSREWKNVNEDLK